MSEVRVLPAITDRSPLLAGSDFRALCRLGLARVSDPALVDTLNAVLAVRGKPICATKL